MTIQDALLNANDHTTLNASLVALLHVTLINMIT